MINDDANFNEKHDTFVGRKSFRDYACNRDFTWRLDAAKVDRSRIPAQNQHPRARRSENRDCTLKRNADSIRDQ
jgi:hypothetical protein